jgi:tetratricopeptide (TPR) repeat protein
MDPPGLDLNDDFTGAKIAEYITGRPLKPSAVSRFWMRESWKDIQRDPLRYIGLFGVKIAYYLNRAEIPNAESYLLAKNYSPFYSIPLVGFPIAGIFGLVGIALTIRRRTTGSTAHGYDNGASLLLLFMLGHLISTAMFFIAARYRISAVPVLLVFASMALVRAFDDARKKSRKDMARFAAVAAIAAIVVFFPWKNINDRVSRASAFNNLGLFFRANGNVATARQCYDSAIRDYPGYWRAYANLANLSLAGGERENALSWYVEGLKNGLSDDSCAMAIHMNIGALLLKDGNTEEAKRHFALAYPYVSYSLTMRRIKDELKL